MRSVTAMQFGAGLFGSCPPFSPKARRHMRTRRPI